MCPSPRRSAQEREREATAEHHRKHNEQLLQQNRALEEEIERLRKVQAEVLQRSEALPGGEARQYLFFEATKTRKILRNPDSTISWRGVREEPRPSTAYSPFASSSTTDRLAAARARRRAAAAAAQERSSPPRARGGGSPPTEGRTEPSRGRPARPESARN